MLIRNPRAGVNIIRLEPDDPAAQEALAVEHLDRHLTAFKLPNAAAIERQRLYGRDTPAQADHQTNPKRQRGPSANPPRAPQRGMPAGNNRAACPLPAP